MKVRFQILKEEERNLPNIISTPQIFPIRRVTCVLKWAQSGDWEKQALPLLL